MPEIHITRLMQEHKAWKRDHPTGFIAKPSKNADGSLNLMRWNCRIPGLPNTLYEGGLLPVVMEFSSDYPQMPPKCRFDPPLCHPNIFPSGTVCLSLLAEGKQWRPSLRVKDILLGIQSLLEGVNLEDPANERGYRLYQEDREAYNKQIIEYVRQHSTALRD
ncbi:hypothetical protein RCL1_000659 [Eukaryota sp. TZLM3-RCL]